MTKRINIPTTDDKIFAGDSFTINLTVEEDDGVKNLDGAKVDFAMSLYPGSEHLIFKDTDDNAVTITEPEEGKVRIDVNGEETHDLPIVEERSFYYRIKVTDIAEKTDTVAFGYITIHDDYKHSNGDE